MLVQMRALDVRALSIDGVDAVAAAVRLPDDYMYDVLAVVAARAASSEMVAFVQVITPAQLTAVGFVDWPFPKFLEIPVEIK